MGQGELELMLEVFNLFDTTNYDVGSVVRQRVVWIRTTGQSSQPRVRNLHRDPAPREIQLGLRYSF